MLVDLIQAAARNQAAWADKQLQAHGIDCRYSEHLWTCWEQSQPTSIHHQAVTVTAVGDSATIMAEIEELVSGHEGNPVEVLDWWRELDLAPLGFDRKPVSVRIGVCNSTP